MQKYWEAVGLHNAGLGVKLEFRAALALTLIERWGLVAGTRDKESDAAGRRDICLLSVEETVARAFALADQFTAVAEQRGDLAGITKEDHLLAMTEIGDLESAKHRAAFNRTPEEEAARQERLVRLRKKVEAENPPAEPATT